MTIIRNGKAALLGVGRVRRRWRLGGFRRWALNRFFGRLFALLRLCFFPFLRRGLRRSRRLGHGRPFHGLCRWSHWRWSRGRALSAREWGGPGGGPRFIDRRKRGSQRAFGRRAERVRSHRHGVESCGRIGTRV